MGDSAVTKCENVGMNEKGGIAWVRIQMMDIPLPLSVMVMISRSCPQYSRVLQSKTDFFGVEMSSYVRKIPLFHS